MTRPASLNHIFRTLWNSALGAMVAVAETGRCSRRGPSTGQRGALPGALFLALKPIPALVFIGFVAINNIANANPVGGVAVVGQMSTSTTGNQLVVTTQNGPGLNHSAIHWQSFSIGPGQSTHFQQPSASSTVVNRVVTNNPTQIFGTLSSNGHLVLVNQAGIAVGAGAVVDTAGFVASTLPMSDADTLLGRLRFGGTGAALQVDGQVLARSGDVVLIGNQVQTGTQALIQAPNGSTVLAAGQQVEITGRGLEGIHLTVQAPSDQAVNLGRLEGDAVAIFAGTLKHSGAIQATQATLEGGKVVLKAAGDAVVDGQGSISARAGQRGGSVDVLGQRVGLADQAHIDASGAQGGGSVRIGGDYQGRNAQVPNAQITYVGQGTHIDASATEQGDGGRVIVWADGTTQAHGRIDAKGGAQGGNGGFVETSGKQVLQASAQVDASAAKGKGGTWLLDPYNISIDTNTTSNISGGPLFSATDEPATLNVGAVTSALEGGTDVSVLTTHGTITVNTSVAWTSANTLTLESTDGITLNQGIMGTAGTLVLTTGGTGAIGNNAGAGLIKVDKLKAYGSTLLLQGMNEINVFAGQTTSGSLALENARDLVVGSVAGMDGATAASGDVFIALNYSNKQLTVVKNVQATAGNVVYVADNLAHNAFTTTSGASDKYVQIRPYTASTAIEFSSAADSAGVLRLSGTELSFSTPMLRLGSAAHTGGIQFQQSVAPVAFSKLSLVTAGSIGQSAGASVQVDSLNAEGRAGVAMNQANQVAKLGGRSDTGAFTFNNQAALQIEQVDANNGIVAGNGNAITLSSTGALSQGAGTLIDTSGKLMASASGGIALNAGVNSAREVMLQNTGSGSVDYASNVGAANTLRVAGENLASNALFALTEASGSIEVNASTGSLRTAGGSIQLKVQGVDKSVAVLSGAQVYSTYGGGNGDIRFETGALSLGGAVAAGSGTVTVTRNRAGVTLALGAASGSNTLGLLQSDLDAISAAALHLGDTSLSGDVYIAAPVARSGATVALLSVDKVHQADGATLDLGSSGALRFKAARVELDRATNRVGTLAGQSTVGDVAFAAAGDYTVGTVGGATGIAAAGNVSLYTGGQITLAQTITAAGNARLMAGAVADGNGSANNLVANTLELHTLQSGNSELDATINDLQLRTRPTHYASAPAAATLGSGDIQLRIGSNTYSVPGATLSGSAKQRGDTLAQAINTLYASTGVSAFTDMGGNLVLVGGGNASFEVLNGGGAFASTGLSAGTYTPTSAGQIAVRTNAPLNIAGIDVSRSVSLAVAGGLTQTGAVALTGSGAQLTVQAQGAVDLTHSGNTVSRVQISNSGASGAVSLLTSATNLNIQGISNAATTAGHVSVRNSTGDVTLAAPISTASGGDITVSVGNGSGRLFNSYGAGALAAGSGGRWLVYSNNPDNDTLNGLGGNFRHYNQAFTGSAYAGPGTGNGVLYSLAPTLGLAVSGSTTKVYDGSTSATVAGYTTTGLHLGETATVTTASAVYNDKDVPDASSVTATIGAVSIKDGTVDVYGYTVPTSASGTGSITPKALTASYTAAHKVYDGNVAASVSASSADIVGADVVSFSQSASFADKNVGTGKVVTVSGIALGGADAANYSLQSSSASTTANITRAASVAWVGGSSGVWSNASNWAGGALPDNANVAEVIIPVGTTVDYDMASSTAVDRISSSGTLQVSGAGPLSIADYLKTDYYVQSAGAVSGTGSAYAEIRKGVNKTGGSLVMPEAVFVRQLSGNLNLSNVQAKRMALVADTGGINADVKHTPSTALELVGVAALGGNVVINNYGGIVTTGAVVATAGSVQIDTHSPITIGSAGVAASGNIVLNATTPDSSSVITLNGALSSSGGSVQIHAYQSVVQNSAITAASSVSVAATAGSVILGAGATTDGASVSYTVAGVGVVPPLTKGGLLASTSSTQSSTVVNSFLDSLETAVEQKQEQEVAERLASAEEPQEKKKEQEKQAEQSTQTEGEICLR
ncbi:MAG: two-partner secretion domain-containing protein [Rhodoferax sp.]